jgi:DNA-binding transcriptional MerR regulator
MDKDGLIPIGRFAKLTDLSPRLLRRLDERGLLSPAVVDPDTRYRYYAIGQTRVAGLIHLGRQMGLTIDQLAGLIAAADHGDLHEHLARHREIVARKLAEQSRLLRLLDQELARDDGLTTYDVALKEAPPVLVVSAAGSVRRTHPHDPWALEGALRRVGARTILHVARQGAEPDEHAVILYHTDSRPGSRSTRTRSATRRPRRRSTRSRTRARSTERATGGRASPTSSWSPRATSAGSPNWA